MQDDAALRHHYAGGPIISDRRNDFSRCVVSPHAPIVAYDPQEVARAIDLGRLRSGDQLARALGDLNVLVGVVPDFPVASLMAVRHGDDPDVPGADVDWVRSYNFV